MASPRTSTILRWDGGEVVPTEGPYAEAKEHLAGFFILDRASRERAEELAARFAGPGDVIELRPVMAGRPEDA